MARSAAWTGIGLCGSASAVKPVWAAAAVAAAGADAVEPLSHSALALSDNAAAGRLIDLAGGIDAVNAWAAGTAELGGTGLSHWYGRLASSGLRAEPDHRAGLGLVLCAVAPRRAVGDSGDRSAPKGGCARHPGGCRASTAPLPTGCRGP